MSDIPEQQINEGSEEKSLIEGIAKISTAARMYLEGGQIIEDLDEPEELQMTLSQTLRLMTPILVGELERLGILFNEPLEEMVGDLFRLRMLLRLRCVLDKDLFAQMLKALPPKVTDELAALVQVAVEGETDVSVLVQQLIAMISTALPIVEDWTILNENVHLFASTHRLAEHLNAIIRQQPQRDELEGRPVEEIAALLLECAEHQNRFSFALKALNARYAKFTEDEITIYVRDYERDATDLITSAGVVPGDLIKHRENVPYHFLYYQKRKQEFDLRALMLIASALYATQYPQHVQRLAALIAPYRLIYEVQTKLADMMQVIPKMPEVKAV